MVAPSRGQVSEGLFRSGADRRVAGRFVAVGGVGSTRRPTRRVAPPPGPTHRGGLNRAAAPWGGVSRW